MAGSKKPNKKPIKPEPVSTTRKEPLKKHPWTDTIKNRNLNKIVRAHNSVKNPAYPAPKLLENQRQKPYSDPITLTVLGNRVTKEFIYCTKMVQGMHKYRPKSFALPVIKDYTNVEWPLIENDLKAKHGGLAYCLQGQVAVLYNEKLLGGAEELKEFIESKYIYHLAIDYQKETINQFRNFVNTTGRSFAYLHVSIGEFPIGTLIFMLYSDICPLTCENFLRLCATKKGGYSGTPIHRIVKEGWIQCGGFGLKDTNLGCENFQVSHDSRGVLSMCNAERDIDCSTQFFVLLQPATWMDKKYVAFGQLIDGEETLKIIEEVPTFYEAPTENIIIYKAGILNLEYDDTLDKRGVVSYIHGHIEDLVSLGEMLSEWLIQQVNLEIECRYIRYSESKNEERGLKRLSFKTEEQTLSKTSMKYDSENLAMRVSELGEHLAIISELEELDRYSSHAQFAPPPTAEVMILERRQFYIPPTDVLYPEEIDSDFDLKRVLKGDYCLEADLDPAQPKRPREYKLPLRPLNSYRSSSGDLRITEISDPEISELSEDLFEEEREEIEEYLRNYVEKVSFSGKVIKKIGKKFVRKHWTDTKCAKFTDEELRKIRIARQDSFEPKKIRVTLDITPGHNQTKIQRRQTGFLGYYGYYPGEEDSDSDNVVDIYKDLQEKRSGMPLPGILSKNVRGRRESSAPGELIDTTKLPKVQIAAESKSVMDQGQQLRSKSSGLRDYSRGRLSVLTRLYEAVAMDQLDEAPTLKGFKPRIQKKQEFMITSSENIKGILTKSIRVSASIDSFPAPYSLYEIKKHGDTKETENKKAEYIIRPRTNFMRSTRLITVEEYRKKNCPQQTKEKKEKL